MANYISFHKKEVLYVNLQILLNIQKHQKLVWHITSFLASSHELLFFVLNISIQLIVTQITTISTAAQVSTF